MIAAWRMQWTVVASTALSSTVALSSHIKIVYIFEREEASALVGQCSESCSVDGMSSRSNLGICAIHLIYPNGCQCKTPADGEAHVEATYDKWYFPATLVGDAEAEASGIKPNTWVHNSDQSAEAVSAEGSACPDANSDKRNDEAATACNDAV